MIDILENWSIASLDFYLAKLAELRGSSLNDVSLKMLHASIWRCKATRKSPAFYSHLQDLRIERHLDEHALLQLKNIAPNRVMVSVDLSCMDG